MRALLHRIWPARGAGPGPSGDAPGWNGGPPAPDVPVAVIGDVHGRHDLLVQLLPQLDGVIADGGQVVLVGDHIDRGEDSAAVIDALMGRPDLVCLMGNHEAMCLAFLDDPVRHGARWLRHGGLQTLASFGVGFDARSDARSETGAAPAGDGLLGLRDGLARAMGDGRIDWLRGLPLRWQSGNLGVTHAGADPGLPLGAQTARTLLWGHGDFARRARDDGLWIAHGHVIVDAPAAAAGRIAVDTGAFATGRLSAAVIDRDGLRFVST